MSSSCRTGGARSWLSVLAWLTLVSATTGCASGTRGTRVPPAAIDPALLVKAGPLPEAMSGRFQDLAENHRQVTKQYHQTATQLNALIDVVNEPEPPPPWWQFWKIYF